MACKRAARRKDQSSSAGRLRRSAPRVWLEVCACACAAILAMVLANAGARLVRGQAENPQAKPAQQAPAKQNPANQNPNSQATNNNQGPGDQTQANPAAQNADQNVQPGQAVPGDPDATMAPDPDAPVVANPAPGAKALSGDAAKSDAATPGNASPVAAAAPAVPARPLTPEEKRKQDVSNACADLLKMATDLKAEVDKSSKDELSIAVIRKAGQIEQYARKVRTAPQLTLTTNGRESAREVVKR